jgi:hypothetical protein
MQYRVASGNAFAFIPTKRAVAQIALTGPRGCCASAYPKKVEKEALSTNQDFFHPICSEAKRLQIRVSEPKRRVLGFQWSRAKGLSKNDI